MRIKPLSKRGTVVVELNGQAEQLLAEAPSLKLRQILVPTDFSDCSEKALRYALSFAQQFQAGLVLLHVIELYPIDYLLGVKSTMEANDWLREQAQARLGQMRQQCARAGLVHAETVTTFGKPFREIARVATEWNVDLIIIATHGYTGLKHIQLGSTAERVVRHAPCPVLVVRGHEGGAVPA